LLEQVLAERVAGRPGAMLASAQLTQLLFLHLLRTLIEQPHGVAGGRLRALCDARIAPALRALHAEPSRDWQLAELAKLSAMSRTAFAVYFKSVAGVAPFAYLTELRMRLAERALSSSSASVASVAASLGYGSESAFSTAFKRATGVPPSQYRAKIASSSS
jgi:AraC-like DNA-binding protein